MLWGLYGTFTGHVLSGRRDNGFVACFDEHVVERADVQFGPAVVVGLNNPNAMAAPNRKGEEG